MTLVTQAAVFAANAHDGATRKGSGIPYIVHPMEAAAIAATLTDDPHVVAAAMLHDVMEDCGVGFEELRARFGERVAMNTPIQGTAADIIKLAMIRVADGIARQGLRSKMIIQVHDELIFDVPRDEVEQMTALVRQCMETDDLLVPLEVNIGIGANWLEAH